MKNINVKLHGESPLLHDAMPLSAIKDLGGISPPKKRGLREIPKAQDALYQNGQGCYIPFNNMFKCIVNVAKQFQQPGKRGASYAKTLAGALTILEEELPMTPSKWEATPESVFGRPVKNHRNGNSIWKESPMFREWSVEFTIQLADFFDPEVLRQILEQAGMVEGICGWRPACGGRFGKFSIEKFEVV